MRRSEWSCIARINLAFLFNVVVILLLIPYTVVCTFGVGLGFMIYPPFGQRMHRLWAQGICFALGIHFRCINLERMEPGKAYIVAPNHSSGMDILVMAALPFPFKWISKKEMGQIPLFGWAMRKMGNYFVSRDRSGKDLNVMQSVEDGLKSGNSVMIFPKGHAPGPVKCFP